MKKGILVAIFAMVLVSFIGCKKEVIGIKASIMEFGASEECAYILVLDEAIDDEKWFIPTNLSEQFRTYTLPNVEVSFKKTGDYCECNWTSGASPDGMNLPTYTLEKVEIIEIEEL